VRQRPGDTHGIDHDEESDKGRNGLLDLKFGHHR